MVRLRIKYQKTGAIRYASHRDTMRAFRRSFAAGQLPVCYSQGFNPHPRLSFGPSLRTGWEGLDEYLDAMFESPVPDIETRCNPVLPEGLRIVETARLDESVPKLSADVNAARFEITIDGRNLAAGQRERKTTFLDHTEPAGDAAQEPVVLEIQTHRNNGDTRIEYLTTMHGGRYVRPEAVVTALFADPSTFRIPIRVVRTALYVRRRGAYESPISKGVVQDNV